MPQTSEPSSRKHTHRRDRRSWLGRKLHRIQKSKRAKRALLQLLVTIAALLIAFYLGFYFFGPGFTNSGK